jgi:DNA-binding NtrC family response regulator
MKELQAREWPGNVRELENLIERVLITSRGTRFELGGEVASHDDAVPAARNLPGAPRTLAQLERDHIVATLEQLEWRIEGAGGAAEALGINASTLRSRMQKHGIRRPVAGTDKERANPSRGAISAP